MPLTAAVALAVAAGLDVAVAEPPARLHPVAGFGRVVGRVEDGWNERRPSTASEALGARDAPTRMAGVLAALSLPIGFAGAAAAVVALGARLDLRVGVALAAGVLFSTTSARLLLDSAEDVIRESDADLDAARRDLRSLAGRDPDALDAPHLRSAAVESLAENLADGLVAPLVAFAVVAAVGGSLVEGTPGAAPLPLAAGAGAAAWVKGVNTMDSMWGYRSKPIGWAAARLDDAVMWVPARLTAALLAVAAGAPTLPARRRVRRFAGRPSSPNSGWPMAAMAALLSARLHKPGAYDLAPVAAGDETTAAAGESAGAPLPDVAAATRAVRVTRRAAALAVAFAGVVAWF
ncbi:MAG: CobD/CbiB family cobalamin biosynthesis protein [Haloquadratum sp.]